MVMVYRQCLISVLFACYKPTAAEDIKASRNIIIPAYNIKTSKS